MYLNNGPLYQIKGQQNKLLIFTRLYHTLNNKTKCMKEFVEQILKNPAQCLEVRSKHIFRG